MAEKTPYKIIGKIIDIKSKSPIVGTEITYKESFTYSGKDGSFSLNGELEENERIEIKIAKDGYKPLLKIPYDNDGSLKNNLETISLQPNKSNLEIEKVKASQLDDKVLENIASPDGSSNAQQKALNKAIIKMKTFLIPSILTMLAGFGVTNALSHINNRKEPINPSCPPEEEVKNIIKKRNKIAKQLNSLYKVVDTATQSLILLEGVVTTTRTLFNTLSKIPIPTPPTPAPSLVPPIQDLKPKLSQNIEKFSRINRGTLGILGILRSTLKTVLDLLSLLDSQIQNCISSDELVAVNKELLELNKEQQQKTPVIPEVNGFNFGIETETTTKDLKRKRAVAKNSRGIILIKGEYSYSAIDQILIDELIFYIQTNDLKAD